MHFTTFVSLSLVCFLRVSNVDAGQFALRHQPRSQLLSRSSDNDATFFEPTDEESFFMAAGELTKAKPYIYLEDLLTEAQIDDDNNVVQTIHKTSRRRYVNFEKFEDYLLPQDQLCTVLPNNRTTLLKFPLQAEHYSAARASWEGKKNLVFVGHDPSCFAPEEERSSFK